MLWETAGIKLKEAALTADQIQNLFKEIETSATAAGGNRTVLGKGKDAATAVNKAWEDLKTKIQDSGPVKAVDQKYDDAIAKIEAGLGGPDNKVNQVIQRYRKFAKENPVAQGFVYAALIAAAGISGAGLGGAAVLGLLKMSDKLLQGEKFSSAAYAGAKTGILAFAASKIGDYIKDKFATYTTENTYYVNGQEVDKATYEATLKGIQNDLAKKGIDFEKGTFDKTAVDAVVKDQLGSAASSAGNAASTGSNLSNQIFDQSLSNPAGRSAARQAVAAALDSGDITAAQGKELIKQIGSAAANPEAAERAITQTLQNVGSGAARKAMLKGESQSRKGKKLSEGQVYLVFNRVCAKQLNEGPLDAIKGLAGKAADKAKTFGKNLTTKVTADKLNKAWQSAGSPTDSEELKSFLISQGVSDDVVANTYQSLKIADTAASTDAPAAEKSAKLGIGQINKILPTLRTRDLLSIQKTVLNAIASKQTAST